MSESVRPRNSFFFGGSKCLLPSSKPGSKTDFVIAKLYIYIFMLLSFWLCR